MFVWCLLVQVADTYDRGGWRFEFCEKGNEEQKEGERRSETGNGQAAAENTKTEQISPATLGFTYPKESLK